MKNTKKFNPADYMKKHIYHSQILAEDGSTMFSEMKVGEYFVPMTDIGDKKRWRKRACQAGRKGSKYFSLVPFGFNKDRFFIVRVK